MNAPVVTDRSCQERVCHVDLGPIKLQNCIIPDNAICAGGMGGRGPCRVRFNNTESLKLFCRVVIFNAHIPPLEIILTIAISVEKQSY